jgi:hypothetical protein
MVNEACEYKSIMPWHKDWQHVEFLVNANSEPDAVFNSPDVQEAMRRSMRHVHAPSFELYCRNAVFMAMKHGMTPFHVDWIHVETIKKGIEQKPVFIYNKKLIHFSCMYYRTRGFACGYNRGYTQCHEACLRAFKTQKDSTALHDTAVQCSVYTR